MTKEIGYGELSKRAQELKEINNKIEQAEKGLKGLKKLKEHYEMTLIPELMQDIEMETFTLTDGSFVQIKNFLHASLSGKAKDFVLQWLRDNEEDAIIKRTVQLTFGKGEDEIADAITKVILEKGREMDAQLVVKESEDVNTATFKSVVRELLEQGEDLPLKEMGVYTGEMAVINMP